MLDPEISLLPEDDSTADTRRRPRRRSTKIVLGLLAAAMLVGVGAGSTAWAAGGFSDVQPGHPFYNEVSWMDHHNISNGYPDGTFKPSDAVSRGALSAFLRRYNFEFSTHSHVFGTSGDYAIDEVSCPAGKSPLGGGGHINQGAVFITDSHQTSTGWYVRWETEANVSKALSGTVYVTCRPNNQQS